MFAGRRPEQPALVVRKMASTTLVGSSISWIRSISSGSTMPSPTMVPLNQSIMPPQNQEQTRISGILPRLAGLDQGQRFQ